MPESTHVNNKSSGKGISAESSKKKETKGVETLLGDPKKAIIKLSLPMIAAMSVQFIQSL